MSLFGHHHAFLAHAAVLFAVACLLARLQILYDFFDLFFPRFLVAVDVVDHISQSLFRLIEFLLIGLLDVLPDGFGGFDPDIVFDDVHIFIDFEDLLILIQKGQLETALS